MSIGNADGSPIAVGSMDPNAIGTGWPSMLNEGGGGGVRVPRPVAKKKTLSPDEAGFGCPAALGKVSSGLAPVIIPGEKVLNVIGNGSELSPFFWTTSIAGPG